MRDFEFIFMSRVLVHKYPSFKHLADFSGKFAASTTLSQVEGGLIKIRASQINGCAYCLDMHIRDALKYGEQQQRIDLMSAWREVPALYTPEEQAILALCEEMTLISQRHGVSDSTYNNARGMSIDACIVFEPPIAFFRFPPYFFFFFTHSFSSTSLFNFLIYSFNYLFICFIYIYIYLDI
jgi:AhpD family alkylhydroperoxidase